MWATKMAHVARNSADPRRSWHHPGRTKPDRRFAVGVADQAAVIEKGRIVWTGPLDTLRQDAALRAEHLHL